MFEIAPALLRQLNRTMTGILSARGGDPHHKIELPKRDSPHLRIGPARHKFPIVTLSAIERSENHLRSLLAPKGFWEALVYDNATITSEYVMFLTFLGLLDRDLARRARKTLLDGQLPDGGWNIYGGGPSDPSATVETYFALKLCGLRADHPSLVEARRLILANGGVEATRVFTKIHLAMFGLYPWNRIPVISPELMLLPRKSPIHIYEFSSWSRAVIIPLLIIFDKKPIAPLPRSQHLTEITLPGAPAKSSRPLRQVLKDRRMSLDQIFGIVQKALVVYEKLPLKPMRKQALRAAEKWILDHQDRDGSWCGIFPAMANSIIALHLRGHSLRQPRMRKGLAVLRSYGEDRPDSFRMQSTASPVWDTAIAAYAFQQAGIPPTDPDIAKAVDWLVSKQILDVSGDWRFKALKVRPGGWPFEHHNAHYPDIDDTALVLLALLPSEAFPHRRRTVSSAIDRGIEWMIGMQGSDGGWGAFDRDNNRQVLNQIPFADLKSLLDPSTPDVTGHVLEALGVAGYDRETPVVSRALQFIEAKQESDGSWFGRWGVNYIYGTSAVLSALPYVRENMKRKYIAHARDWLQSIQRRDGGWGESCASYDEGKYVPLGTSTASQTAWALIGLLACPGTEPSVITRGVEYLISKQKADGSWDEPEWTGTGFPRHFYLRYDYYRLYFPLLALARYSSQHRRFSRERAGNA